MDLPPLPSGWVARGPNRLVSLTGPTKQRHLHLNYGTSNYFYSNMIRHLHTEEEDREKTTKHYAKIKKGV